MTRKFWRKGLALGGAAATAMAAGCSAMRPAPITPSSTLAEQAAMVSAERGDYPNIADIPPMPTDVRAAAQWRTAVQNAESAGRRILAETAPGTFTLKDTEVFAARARRQGEAPPPMTTASDTEAFAKALRERATPPPSPR